MEILKIIKEGLEFNKTEPKPSIEETEKFWNEKLDQLYSTPTRCMPSRSQIREDIRLSEYEKRMISERAKFIERFPILNLPPPQKKINKI